MKKKIIFIIISVLLMIGALIYTGITFSGASKKVFVKAGYVLSADKKNENSVNDNSVKYYFSENTSYKNSFDNTIEFNDTDGNSVRIDDATFVHYNDDSISLLKKGVIFNLDEINNKIPKYYNLFENTLLEHDNSFYYVDNLGKKLKFSSFIVKIDENKYLLVSDEIKLKLGEEDIDVKEKYIEFSYIEEGIIKIENKSASYKTIAKDARVYVNKDFYLNLDNGYFYVKDKAKLSLNHIIINSDDNIDIEPLEEEKEDEDEEEEVVGDNGASGGNGSNAQEDANGGTAGGIFDDSGIEEEVVENQLTTPTGVVSSLVVRSTTIEGLITITDPDSLITGPAIVSIVEVSTGKTVYNKSYDEGTYNINFSVDSLKAGTVYNLTARVTYNRDTVVYNMDIVQQLIVTEGVGVSIEKDYYTLNSLSFKVNIEGESNIKSAKVSLYETSGGNPIAYHDIEIPESEIGTDKTYDILFDTNVLKDEKLSSNTKYVVKVENIYYDNIKLNNVVEMSAKTLKKRPEIGEVDYVINKKESKFSLKLSKLIDIDSGIEKLIYEVYDVNSLGEGDDPFAGQKPVSVIETKNSTSVDLIVDDVNIKRNNKYVFRVIGVFYDNEKYIEYNASLTSSVMNMEGRKAPYLTWSPIEVGWEHIVGTVTVNNPESIVRKTSKDFLLVTITNTTVGTSKSYRATLDENDSFPLDINYLIADSMYSISVTGAVNFGDNNGVIDSYHIGSFMVRTASPLPISVSVVQNTNATGLFEANVTFKGTYDSSGNYSNVELSTLTYYRVSMYEDMQATVPMYSTVISDKNLNIYESDFGEPGYSFKVTVDTFTNETEFLMQWGSLTQYVIRVEEAYDYTYDTYYNSHGIKVNNISLVDDTFENITLSKRIPLPAETNNSVKVTKIKNEYSSSYGIEKNEGLKDDTIVGISATAILGDLDASYVIKSITYTLYGSKRVDGADVIDLDNKIDSKKYSLTSNSIPSPTFKIGDKNFVRGKSYFVTYDAVIAINQTEEEVYPDKSTGIILRSSAISIPKQNFDMEMFVSDSSYNRENGITNLKLNYRLNDPDIAINTNTDGYRQMFATIYKKDADGNEETVGNCQNCVQQISPSGEFQELEFNFVNIDNNYNYYIRLFTLSTVHNSSASSRNVHFDQLFEGTISTPTLNYELVYGDEQVSKNIIHINTTGYTQAFFNRIARYVVKFTYDGKEKTKEIKEFYFDGFDIALMDIKNLFNPEDNTIVGKTFSVAVSAYYDSGLVAFVPPTEEKNNLFAVKYAPTTTNYEYFKYNYSDLTVNNPSAKDSLFVMTKNGTSINMSLHNANNKFDFVGPTSCGYSYNNRVVTANKISSVNFNTSLSNEFTAKETAGVDMYKDNGFTNYEKGIDRVTIHPVFYGVKDNDSIVVELTTGGKVVYSKSVVASEISDKDYEIDGLSPGANYILRFYKCNGEEPEVCSSTEIIIDLLGGTNSSNSWFLKTIDDIEIEFYNSENDGSGSGNSAADPFNYSQLLWEEKKISIKHTVGVTSGYSALRYKLYYRDSEDEDWKLFKYKIYDGNYYQSNNDLDDPYQVLQINIGKDMEFGVDYSKNKYFNFNMSDKFKEVIRLYKLEVVPVLGTQELDIAKATYYFTLPTHSEPVFRATSAFLDVSTSNPKLQLVVQSVDPHRILFEKTYDGNTGKYFIKRFTDLNNENFAVDFVNKAYSSNRVFIAENINPYSSYFLSIDYSFDLNNDGIINETYEARTLDYQTRSLNASGVDFGDVTYSVINDQFVLYFEDCSIPSTVDDVEYVIVDNNVSGQENIYYSGSASFEQHGEKGKKLVLPTTLQYLGSYHIQINLYDAGNELGSYALNAMYNVS